MKRSASVSAVALLVLLARAAPARVVAPDLLVLVDAALLDDRRSVLGVDLAIGARAVDRLPGVDEPPAAAAAWSALGCSVPTPPVYWTARGRPAAAGLRARRRVGALDLDLDVEDHPREVGPDRVHQVR